MILKEDEEWLAHYGVKGMKWGVRKERNKASVESFKKKGLSSRQAKATVKKQNFVDSQRIVAAGKQKSYSILQRAKNRSASNLQLGPRAALRHPLSVQKAAVKQLEINREIQAKVKAGGVSATAILMKIGGVSISDIDYKL